MLTDFERYLAALDPPYTWEYAVLHDSGRILHTSTSYRSCLDVLAGLRWCTVQHCQILRRPYGTLDHWSVDWSNDDAD